MLNNIKIKLKNKDWRIDFILKLIFIFMPIFVISFMQLWKGFRISKLIPVYSDEMSWYGQVMSVVEYGSPLGYYGYNATHAVLGTFEPWGPFIIYFMAIIPAILKYILGISGYHVIILGNIFWLCFANFLFLILTNPKRKNIIKLIIGSIILYLIWIYVLLLMAESLRYSFSIILAGMMIYCLNSSSKTKMYPIMLYVITPIVILLFMSTYVMFSAVIPIWLYCIYKRNVEILSKHKILYILGGLLLCGIVTLGIFYVNALFSAPYITNGYDNIIEAFKIGIIPGIRNVFDVFLNSAKSVDIWSMLNMSNIDYGSITFYVLFYYLTMALLISSIYKSLKKKQIQNAENSIISLYMLTIFLLGFFILYSVERWTLVRGINVALIFVIYIQAVSNQNTIDFKKVVSFACLGILPMAMFWTSSTIPNRMSEEKIEMLNDYKNIFDRYIQVDSKNESWENSIAMYGSPENLLSGAFPAGIGLNYMINNDINNINAKYAVVFHNEELANEIERNNYTKVYSDDKVAILIQE